MRRQRFGGWLMPRLWSVERKAVEASLRPPECPKGRRRGLGSAVATCNPRSNGKEGRQEAQGSGLLPQPCCGLVPRKPRLPGLGKGAP